MFIFLELKKTRSMDLLEECLTEIQLLSENVTNWCDCKKCPPLPAGEHLQLGRNFTVRSTLRLKPFDAFLLLDHCASQNVALIMGGGGLKCPNLYIKLFLILGRLDLFLQVIWCISLVVSVILPCSSIIVLVFSESVSSILIDMSTCLAR